MGRGGVVPRKVHGVSKVGFVGSSQVWLHQRLLLSIEVVLWKTGQRDNHQLGEGKWAKRAHRQIVLLVVQSDVAEARGVHDRLGY